MGDGERGGHLATGGSARTTAVSADDRNSDDHEQSAKGDETKVPRQRATEVVPYVVDAEDEVDHAFDDVENPQPVSSSPVRVVALALVPLWSAAHSRYRPTTISSQVAAWKSPFHKVLSSSEATLVIGKLAWTPWSVPMWCHCRIWCKRIPSSSPPRPRPRSNPGTEKQPRHRQGPRRRPVTSSHRRCFPGHSPPWSRPHDCYPSCRTSCSRCCGASSDGFRTGGLSVEVTEAGGPSGASRQGFDLDPVHGARPLRRFISYEVDTRIGRALLGATSGTEHGIAVDAQGAS